MIALNLTAKDTEQEIIKKYLEENASELLAEKINNGVRIVKDGKTLISRKTLDGFMKYAQEEARKLATKGASCACIEDKVVFGWAIHYFEEDSIEGSLYNEDGTEYKASRPKKAAISTPTTTTVTPPKKAEPKSGQLSLFDFTEKADEEDNPDTDDEDAVETAVEAPESVEDTVDEPEGTEPIEQPVTAKLSPLFERYMNFKTKYPENIIVLRVGDFYEIFGDDAKKASSILDLTLTSRDVGLEERLPMVGYPYHVEDKYRGKLQKTFDIAVVENDTDVRFYRKEEEQNPAYMVNIETGEVVDYTSSGDDLIQTIMKLFDGDLEVHTK